MQHSRTSTLHLWVPNLFDFKGGIQVYLQNVLQVIVNQVPSPQVVVVNKLDRQASNSQQLPHQVSLLCSGHIMAPLRTLHFVGHALWSVIMHRPQLIVCGHLNFSPLALWIYQLFRIPYWIIVYGIDAWNINNRSKINALKQADRIISISGYTRNRLIQEQGIEPNKIWLLPVTFDANQFAIRPKPHYLLQRYGLQPEQPIILTVARLSKAEQYKGYDVILSSLPKIRKALPKVHYVLIGKGDDRDRIEAMINKLGVANHVTLTGFVPDHELCDHYNLCDVFAMPSKSEGFGIVYLEALACGKPVLAGNQGGAIDALCHGELGVLVSPDDAEVIADALVQLLQGQGTNSLFHQPDALRQRVVEAFGFEQFKQTLCRYLQ